MQAGQFEGLKMPCSNWRSGIEEEWSGVEEGGDAEEMGTLPNCNAGKTLRNLMDRQYWQILINPFSGGPRIPLLLSFVGLEAI